MTHRKLLCTGAAGTAVTALCCFTPLLVVVLGAAGLSVWLGWIDYVLFPAMAGFIAITAYAIYKGGGKPAGIARPGAAESRIFERNGP